MSNALLPRIGRGLLGGVAATFAMSCAMYAARRGGLLGEPPPRKITRALLHRVGVHPSRDDLNIASAAMHLGFGAGVGALYGVLQRRPVAPTAAAGLGVMYGGLVWATSYAGWVPSFDIMARPSRDRPGRPTAMVAAHIVYGTVLAEVVNALLRRREAAGGWRASGRVVVAALPAMRSAAGDLHDVHAPVDAGA